MAPTLLRCATLIFFIWHFSKALKSYRGVAENPGSDAGFRSRITEQFLPKESPYILKLQNGFDIGNVIRVFGFVDGTAPTGRFDIDIVGTDDEATREWRNGIRNILLHVSFRINDNIVILNSRVNGDWGIQEIHTHIVDFGKQYEIDIIAFPFHYQITLNNERFAKFHYRLPVRDASVFVVSRDFSVTYITGWALKVTDLLYYRFAYTALTCCLEHYPSLLPCPGNSMAAAPDAHSVCRCEPDEHRFQQFDFRYCRPNRLWSAQYCDNCDSFGRCRPVSAIRRKFPNDDVMDCYCFDYSENQRRCSFADFSPFKTWENAAHWNGSRRITFDIWPYHFRY